jgi:hypothetical protein
MATSNGDVRPTGENRPSGPSLSRYDVLLLVIPAAFLLAFAASFLFGVPTLPAIAAASAVGIFAVADGLFVNPPL